MSLRVREEAGGGGPARAERRGGAGDDAALRREDVPEAAVPARAGERETPRGEAASRHGDSGEASRHGAVSSRTAWGEPPHDAAPRDAATARADWREVLRDAADLALVGIAVTVCALPVVTLGSALATASAAIRHRREEGRYPHFSVLARDFARGSPSGMVATGVSLVVAVTLAFNLGVARSGLPGGRAVTAVTFAVAAAAAGFGLLVVAVHSGRWRGAVRTAAHVAGSAWWAVPAAGVAVAIAAMIGTLVPATAVLLPGFVVFAGQAVVTRALPVLAARTKASEG